LSYEKIAAFKLGNYFAPQALAGRSWYRVKQVDFGGRFSYSSVVEVYLTSGLMARLAPNPTHSATTLSLQVTQDGPLDLRILDLQGRVIQQQQAELSPGTNQFFLDVSRLAQGMYTVVAQHRQKQLRLPLIVR